MSLLELRARYLEALHKVQTGIQMLLNAPLADYHECEPKHLRVGISSALVDSAALQKVLLDKGVITEEELAKALAELAEREAADYEIRVQKALRYPIKLG